MTGSRELRVPPRARRRLLLVALLAALASLVAASAAAAAVNVEGTWEIPNDSTNDPSGCAIYTTHECTTLYAGTDTLEIVDKGGTLTGQMKSGSYLVGSIGGSEEAEGKLRIIVTGEGSSLFEDYEFKGTLSADGSTMSGGCPEGGAYDEGCFTWTNGEERRRFPWDAVRVGAPAASTTTVECPSTGTGEYRCTAMVSGSSEGRYPTGTVSFSATEGSFATPSCTLEPIAGGGGCSVAFKAPSSAKGPLEVTASYGGDKYFSSSEGKFKIVTTVTIHSANVEEPASGSTTANFAVSLNAASASPVSVEYETVDGTGSGGAIAPEMYEAAKGTVTFAPGETAQTIPVKVLAAGFTGARTFTVKLSNPVGASLESNVATGTIVGPSPLQVTISVSPSSLDVEQDEGGAVPLHPTATVTVKDIGKVPVENVALPAQLTIGWHGPAPINALPIQQLGAPAPAELRLGTLEPAESASRQYDLQVEGDGQFDIQSLVTGSEEGQTVKALGKTTIEPTSQLLVMKNTLGAVVHSTEHPTLIKAGTHFLIRMQLENRSYVHTLQIEPYSPELEGNAKGGAIVAENEPTTYNNPTGAMSEVEIPPVILLAPRQKKTYFVVVGTAASDAFTQGSAGGGTHAAVKFEAPEVSTLDEAEKPVKVEDDRVVLTPGSGEIGASIDESVAPPPPFDPFEAEWAVTKGVAYGLWDLTYGAVKGLADIGVATYKGAKSLTTATIDEMYYLSELWKATEKVPVARQALVQTIQQKLEKAYAEAPWTLQEKGEQLYNTIDAACGAYFTKITNDWYAGDWRQAITDMTEFGTVAGASAGPALYKVFGPAAAGVLTRLAPAVDALNAEKTAAAAKATEELAAATKPIEPAEDAVKALAKVPNDYPYTLKQLRTFIGMDAKEADWLKAFTKAKKVSVVLRSRAEESIEWIKRGAMLKPSWIKSKNVTWADVEFFGYSPKDVGRVVLRKLPDRAGIEKELEVRGIREGSAEYKAAIERWTERDSTYAKEIKQMKEWAHQHDIKGKWPWADSGVDPTVQADKYMDFKFRLGDDEHMPGAHVPEVFNPKTGKWGSITGDIDLVAVSKADGTSFTVEEYVKVLKELADSPLEIQHPDSTVWVMGDKFYFDKKADYLKASGNVQFGADGEARAVTFNEKASEPETWTPFKWRIIWEGGLAPGPGPAP